MKVSHPLKRRRWVLSAKAKKRSQQNRRNNQQYRRRALAAGYRWIHTGGGTSLLSKGRYPCDDSYEHLTTGEVAIFRTTFSAHFARTLPRKAKRLSEVTRLAGVKLRKRVVPCPR